jgi:hypothetical protein
MSQNRMLFIFVIMVLAVSVITVSAEEPNVGILRVASFVYRKEVAPNSTFQVTVDVEYGLHGRPNNATIRAAIYSGVVAQVEPRTDGLVERPPPQKNTSERLVVSG